MMYETGCRTAFSFGSCGDAETRRCSGVDYYWVLPDIGSDWRTIMADEGRVVTAKLPEELAARLDAAGERIERSKSWIIRQAVAEWLAEEQRRDELTREAMKSIDEGRFYTQEEVERYFAEKRKKRSRTAHAA